ncbi:MAG: class I SAM-dependent methyltransferase [Deltaproteobacteria bacterium]|nr:class I SAM-dependent methyltransferase [Deltaproteobacteria bacterium]
MPNSIWSPNPYFRGPPDEPDDFVEKHARTLLGRAKVPRSGLLLDLGAFRGRHGEILRETATKLGARVLNVDGPWALEHLRYAKNRTGIDFIVADLGDLSDIATGQAVGALAWRSLHTRTESPEALSRAIGELSRVLAVGAVALISVRGDASVIGDQPQIRRTEVRNMTRTDYYFGPPSLQALFPPTLEVIRPIEWTEGYDLFADGTRVANCYLTVTVERRP